MLCNQTHVRNYLRSKHPEIRQVSKDFWTALDIRVAGILDQAARLNRGHSRLTSGEMLVSKITPKEGKNGL
jgi:hypothetical protein